MTSCGVMFDTSIELTSRLLLTMIITLQGSSSHTPLSDYITHYEPIYYDTQPLHPLGGALRRTKRSTDEQLLLKFHAYGRTFRVRLKRDASIYSHNIVIENATDHIPYDVSRAYQGYIEGDNSSRVYGTFSTDGVFEGEIQTSDEGYTVERASRYFKVKGHTDHQFHSVIYRHSAVRLDEFNQSTTCLSDALHHKLTRRAVDRAPWHLGFDGGTLHSQSRRILGPQSSQPPVQQTVDPLKTTCTMYLQADHLFYQKFDADEDAVIEQLTQHVQAVNDIYRYIDFDGDGIPDRVNFIIKRIKVWTSATAPGYRFAGNYGVEAFLELLSEDNFDAFCLAYMFTYRDFDGGTLGLAWTGDLHNAGGVCEKNGQYRGSLKSLNSGIVTVLNYGKDVPPSVSHVTMAHEIGHNIGSQHDPETPECSPGGADGNYIMYARATSGDRPNNNKFSSCSKKSMADVLRLKARGVDGCFIPETSAICGNGIVEGDEECDCGWEDECREQCCYPQVSTGTPLGTPCTRRQGAVCSPSEGPCCSSSCQLIGPQSKHVCREQTSCKSDSVCDGSSSQCPPSVNVPDKTRCEDDSVCFHGECSGSICLAYDLEACQCPPARDSDFNDSRLCRLCCKKPGSMSPCRSSAEWNLDPLYHVPLVSAKPGSPCHNFRGYCDVFLKCREVDPTGPLANLKQLLFSAGGIRNIKQWLAVYWYVPSVVAVSLLTSIVAIVKLCQYSVSTDRRSMQQEPVTIPKTTSSVAMFTAFPNVVDHRSKTGVWPRCPPCRVGTVVRAVPHQGACNTAGRSVQGGAVDGNMMYASWV